MGNEFALIDWIRGCSPRSAFVPIGIGDDCAVVRTENGQGELLVAKDVLLEGTHFHLDTSSARLVGRKALAVNLSDIAAMAGVPRSAFIGLVLPRPHGQALAEDLMSGLIELAQECDVCVAGGDTNIWDGPLVISVTVLGDISPPGPVLRSGAKPGDWILVTGRLGGSLESGRHLGFTPRVREALQLQTACQLHGMIDLSDGLSSDLQHILRESGGLGAVIDAGAVPIHDDVPARLADSQRLKRALSDGEDFELLFTVGPEDGRRLLDAPPISCSLTKVGEVTLSGGALLQDADGTTTPLLPSGWEHRF